MFLQRRREATRLALIGLIFIHRVTSPRSSGTHCTLLRRTINSRLTLGDRWPRDTFPPPHFRYFLQDFHDRLPTGCTEHMYPLTVFCLPPPSSPAHLDKRVNLRSKPTPPTLALSSRPPLGLCVHACMHDIACMHDVYDFAAGSNGTDPNKLHRHTVCTRTVSTLSTGRIGKRGRGGYVSRGEEILTYLESDRPVNIDDRESCL